MTKNPVKIRKNLPPPKKNTDNMRLRSIIRTISVSLTTAIIVSCTINGEPEGGRQVTDYQEYEVTVASEKVPGVVTSCGNNILTDVYAVRYAREDDWKMLVSIEGFEYESGYYMK